MTLTEYREYKAAIVDQGYGADIDWAESLTPCDDAERYWQAHAWVVLNSGFRNSIARGIWEALLAAIAEGRPVGNAVRHLGKADAIEKVRADCGGSFARYQEAADKLAYLRTLPWIGPITCWHLARDLGLDVCKPDRYLVRVAESFSTTPQELCSRLARESGNRIGTVDVVIRRAAELGLLESPPTGSAKRKRRTDCAARTTRSIGAAARQEFNGAEAHVWWSYLGDSYRRCRQHGRFFVSHLPTGYTVTCVRPGDLVIHEYRRSIVSVCQVLSVPQERSDDAIWEMEVEFRDLLNPKKYAVIREELRAAEPLDGPMHAVEGSGKPGDLYPCNWEALAVVETATGTDLSAWRKAARNTEGTANTD